MIFADNLRWFDDDADDADDGIEEHNNRYEARDRVHHHELPAGVYDVDKTINSHDRLGEHVMSEYDAPEDVTVQIAPIEDIQLPDIIFLPGHPLPNGVYQIEEQIHPNGVEFIPLFSSLETLFAVCNPWQLYVSMYAAVAIQNFLGRMAILDPPPGSVVGMWTQESVLEYLDILIGDDPEDFSSTQPS